MQNRSAIDRFEPKSQCVPDLAKGIRQIFDQLVVVEGCRGDAKPLGAPRHGWIVDRLEIEREFLHQQCRCFPAQIGIADRDGDDVRLRRHHRNSGFAQRAARLVDLQPMGNPLGH